MILFILSTQLCLSCECRSWGYITENYSFLICVTPQNFKSEFFVKMHLGQNSVLLCKLLVRTVLVFLALFSRSQRTNMSILLPWVGSCLCNIVLFFVVSLFPQYVFCLDAFWGKKSLWVHIESAYRNYGIKNLSFMTEMRLFFFLFLADAWWVIYSGRVQWLISLICLKNFRVLCCS